MWLVRGDLTRCECDLGVVVERGAVSDVTKWLSHRLVGGPTRSSQGQATRQVDFLEIFGLAMRILAPAKLVVTLALIKRKKERKSSHLYLWINV